MKKYMVLIGCVLTTFLGTQANAKPCTPRNGATPCEEAATQNWKAEAPKYLNGRKSLKRKSR